MVAKPQGQKYRLPHDPYNDMERPDFQARQSLSEAESNLPDIQKEAERTKRSYRHQKHSAATRLRQSEENQSSDAIRSTFRNNVAGKTASEVLRSRGRLNGKGGGILKKAAPASIITILLVVGGFIFYGLQTALPQNISSNYTAKTDVQYSSYMTRNQSIVKYMMDGGDQIKISNNLTKRYTSFSPYMKRRLAKQGIEVGQIDKSGNFSTDQIIANKSTVLKYGDDIISADDFQTRFASDANFREAYTKAKRGRVAGFFDESADRYYKKKGKSRDIFDNYRSTGDSEVDETNFRETVNNNVTGSEASINSIHATDTDGDGTKDVGKNGDAIEVSKIEGDTPEIKARSFVNSIAGKIDTATNVGTVACVGLRIANIASVAVAAYQIFQSISYFLSFSEPISKSIAGEGDASGINSVLNFFTTVTDSKVQYVDANGATRTETVTGSLLESEGSQVILTNARANHSKVAPYSLNNIFGSAALVAATTGASQATCSGVMAASAVVSLASNAVPGGTLAKFVVSAVANTVGGIAITAAVGAIVQAIIPYVAKIFAGDIFSSLTGIPAGEFYTQGAAAANFKLATEASAFMPADEEYVKEQNRQTSTTLSQEAEVDRLHRSPFDITSPNTFLGALLSKISFSAIGSSLGNGLAGFGNLISNSFKVFNPSVSAADQEVTYTSNYQTCNNGLGTVCDMYGLEIPSRDYSTINLRPDDKKYNAVIAPNLDNNGKIIEGSELSKFISFCTERESPWGVLDANIMNALQTDFGIVGNNLYIVEDVVDIINAVEDVENRPWGTGENCVMSKNNPRWDNEFKYYQAYVEDMRILSGMENSASDVSAQTNNPVLAYLEEYDEKHPVDDSFTGTLARLTGYTKDDIAFLLEVSRYSSEIANYDYSNLFVFGKNQSEIVSLPKNSYFDSPNILTNIISTPAIFIDRRNYTV